MNMSSRCETLGEAYIRALKDFSVGNNYESSPLHERFLISNEISGGVLPVEAFSAEACEGSSG